MEEHIPASPELQSAAPPVPPPNYYTPPSPPAPYPTARRELIFAAAMALICLSMVNFVLYGGFFLGFAITASASIVCSAWYLSASGHKGNWYTRSVLFLCLVIAASFGYSSDSFVKLVLLMFLGVGVNLALCQQAGQNRYAPGSIRSLLDAPRATLSLGLGKSGRALRGLMQYFRSGGESSRRTGAILAGLAIALPVLIIMVPLLMASDAAFEGLMDHLPDSLSAMEIAFTLVWGAGAFLVLYPRGAALHHEAPPAAAARRCKGLHLLTVNTVLLMVCGLYLVYLLSQIAYFSGGFLGILPDGYSTAQYARRGFFEMAWLCVINLGLITFGISLVSRESAAPLSTRLACLFLGLVTLFLVSASCAKMILYIGSYGLTRLRVLTMAVIAFLALTTAVVSVWLFVPKLQYMKAVVLIALAIGAGVVWMDVDSQVARYNVDAYLSGRLETIDTDHLERLGTSAVPHIARLREAEDSQVAQTAAEILENWYLRDCPDFRSWTYWNHTAREFLPQETEAAEEVRELP